MRAATWTNGPGGIGNLSAPTYDASMLLKQGLSIAFGTAIGIGIGAAIPRAQAQEPAKSTQSVADFPDLVGGLKATPGCMAVRTSAFENGKQLAIFAWFKNKAAVNAWYNSPMHRGAMKRFFPGMQGGTTALEGFKDEKSPLLVVATVSPAEKPMLESTKLAISQIAIEIYTPVPGGLTIGGGFGPNEMDVPGLVRLQRPGGQ